MKKRVLNPFSENETIFGGRASGRLEMGVRGRSPPPGARTKFGIVPLTSKYKKKIRYDFFEKNPIGKEVSDRKFMLGKNMVS